MVASSVSFSGCVDLQVEGTYCGNDPVDHIHNNSHSWLGLKLQVPLQLSATDHAST